MDKESQIILLEITAVLGKDVNTLMRNNLVWYYEMVA